MATKSKLRVTIRFNGSEKTLFSVGQSAKGSMFINIRTAKHFMPDPSVKQTLGTYVEQRYSIHPSRSAPDGNTIHQTVRTSAAAKIEAHLFTRCIKTTNKLIPLFVRCVPDLSDEENSTKDRPTVCIGDIDPNICTLFFGILLCSSRYQFRMPYTMRECNWAQVQFGDYCIVIVWSFLSIQSAPVGCFRYISTSKDRSTLTKEDIVDLDEFINGFDDLEAMIHFVVLAMESADDHINNVINHKYFSNRYSEKDIRRAIFLKNGFADSEYMNWWLFDRPNPRAGRFSIIE